MNYAFEDIEDIFIYNNIIQDLCNAGRQKEGLVLLDMIRSQRSVPKTFVYNNLIGAFCKAGDIEKSRQLFDQMEEDGVRVSVVALNALVDGMCKHGMINMINSALELFADVKSKLGLEGNAITYTSLITGLCNLNNLDKAMALFDEMVSVLRAPLTNTMIYNVLIDSLCKEKKIENAFSLVDHMIAKGVRPDVQTYNAIFRGLRDMNLLDKAFVVMDTMKEQACDPDNITMQWLSTAGETTRLNNFAKAMGVKFNRFRPVIQSRKDKKR
ncbi:hypothetical protein AQUCO_05900008v1 [Aquilegia coerulea]|uniref:Pentacotripeptide-repeat region of PRORP domain-containing protein n=1 Tax=Aquilegia coerulea TaxID=218851 RepID=A0A2G5CE20_AQUCA|nr:hypothetical protein AQUCO_05900008v1 [Aquilegia coerulea]